MVEALPILVQSRRTPPRYVKFRVLSDQHLEIKSEKPLSAGE